MQTRSAHRSNERDYTVPIRPGIPMSLMMLCGMIVGATTGAVAGLVGIASGAVIGSIVGLLAGFASLRQRAMERQEEARLDRVIGVSGGPLGAAKRGQPPARFGAYSGAAAGVGGSAEPPSEGPMQNVDEA